MNTATFSDQAIRHLVLGDQQLLVLVNRPGTRIKVSSGAVWLTEEGQLDDHFAAAGEELRLARSGRTIIEALGHAQLQLIEPARGLALRLRAWLTALRRDPGAVGVHAVSLSLSLALAIGGVEMLARGFHQADADVTAAAAKQATAQPVAPG